MAQNEKDYINQMYDSTLESEKAGLKQNYDQANAQLDQQKQQAQQQTDANLTRTYVEAEKARKNYNEVQNAYGLASGAVAQARLAQDNQLQSDMTTLRAAQQNIDAGIERERSSLAQQYAAAIQQAQANNDLQRAQALYEQAQAEEERLRQQQTNAAGLTANLGDYSRLAELYGISAEELAGIQDANRQKEEEEKLRQQQENAAKLMAEIGDYSRLAELYGLTDEELALLMGQTGAGGSGGSSVGSGDGVWDKTPKEDKPVAVTDGEKAHTYHYRNEEAQKASDAGDYNALAAMYGLSPEELWLLTGRVGS